MTRFYPVSGQFIYLFKKIFIIWVLKANKEIIV
ncbi:hypothetical protein [Candidatus Phytoplasma tritici]